MRKDNKKRNPSDHSPLEEDGEVFNEPWNWKEDEEEQAKAEWQQGTAPDLTPKEDDAGK